MHQSGTLPETSCGLHLSLSTGLILYPVWLRALRCRILLGCVETLYAQCEFRPGPVELSWDMLPHRYTGSSSPNLHDGSPGIESLNVVCFCFAAVEVKKEL